MAFSFFRLAAICQGVAKRAVDGNASNAAADDVWRRWCDRWLSWPHGLSRLAIAWPVCRETQMKGTPGQNPVHKA